MTAVTLTLWLGRCACRTWPLLYGTRTGACGYCGVVPTPTGVTETLTADLTPRLGVEG